jgi:hypothetical protein
MGKRALKKRIQSLLKRIEEHRDKIREEERKTDPDFGLILHWKTEIAAFLISVKKARKRLKS